MNWGAVPLTFLRSPCMHSSESRQLPTFVQTPGYLCFDQGSPKKNCLASPLTTHNPQTYHMTSSREVRYYFKTCLILQCLFFVPSVYLLAVTQ